MAKTAKTKEPAAGVIFIVRGREKHCFLSTEEMSLTEARLEECVEDGSVFVDGICGRILGLPLPKRVGDSLRLTWKQEPAKLITKTKRKVKR